MVTLTTVCLALLCTSAFAQTAEESYRTAGCRFASFNDNGSRHFECCGTSPGVEVLKAYIEEWDIPLPEPEPTSVTGVQYCRTLTNCLSQSYFWYDNMCHVEEQCIPEWCSLPVQDCSLPPLTGGTDSCGEPCSKPSPEWPHCMLDGQMVDKEF